MLLYSELPRAKMPILQLGPNYIILLGACPNTFPGRG